MPRSPACSRNKSGGASVYGATAWLRYSKFIAPLSVWCNWFAWSPVLSLGCSIAAAYILNALAPIPRLHRGLGRRSSPGIGRPMPCTAGRSRRASPPLTAAGDAGDPQLDALQRHARAGLASRSTPTFCIGAVLMLIIFAIQHRGILGTAKRAEIYRPPRHRPAADRRHRADPHRPDQLGQLLAAGAARRRLCAGARRLEHRRLDAGPRRHVHRRLVDLRLRDGGLLHQRVQEPGDATRSRRSSIPGLLCLLLFILVPFTFQGVLGLERHAGDADRRRLGRRRRAWPQMVGGGRHHHSRSRHADDPRAVAVRS